MKKMIIQSLLSIAVLAFMVGPAMAAKPQNVIEKSNGFPSGMHFNLNVHGKGWVTCNAVPDEDDSWGNSIFIPEYGTATIKYVSNKKASVYELTVLDPCGGFDGDKDVAKVQLPYKVEVNGEVIPADGFYVFGRILGKPNNGDKDVVSSIILYPNVVVEACNDPNDPDVDFGSYTSCDELALGVIVGNNLYVAEEEKYVRFDPEAERGKGKSKATDITRLFTYTGWAVDERLDISGPGDVPDGVIDEYDIPTDAWDIIDAAGIDPNVYDGDPEWGNSNEAIDLIEEWLLFQADLEVPMAWYFDEEWIFNIADLVVTEQGLVNDGTKLLQIRFYPVATTEFTPQEPEVQ